MIGFFRKIAGQMPKAVNPVLNAYGLIAERASRKFRPFFHNIGFAVNPYSRGQITEMRDTDFLTGLSSRRKLFVDLKNGFELSKRTKLPFSIIIFDLDYFGEINNAYGHLVGDLVLEKFGSLIRDGYPKIRAYDIAGRYGGEEFIIALYGASEKQAVEVAERILGATRKQSLQELGERRVTASAGVAEIAVNDKTVEALIERADKSLYRAKGKNANGEQVEEGRNRVIAYSSIKENPINDNRLGEAYQKHVYGIEETQMPIGSNLR